VNLSILCQIEGLHEVAYSKDILIFSCMSQVLNIDLAFPTTTAVESFFKSPTALSIGL